MIFIITSFCSCNYYYEEGYDKGYSSGKKMGTKKVMIKENMKDTKKAIRRESQSDNTEVSVIQIYILKVWPLYMISLLKKTFSRAYTKKCE